MRCTPVSEWQTKRGAFHGESTKSRGSKKEKPVDEEEGVLLEGQRTEAKRTYASSYDVSFIFEQLWKKKPHNDQTSRSAPLCCPEVRVPDTIVYRGGFPANWYFHSKVDGRLLKKKPESVYIPRIFEVFGAENGTCDTQVVACFVGTLETAKGPTNNVVYMDRRRLKDFLFGENVMKEGFLQRFVAPEPVPYDSSARNSTIHATWSPYNCIVEQRINKHKLDSRREGVGTSDKVNVSSTRVDTIVVSKHTKLHRKISHQCKLIAEHIAATSTDTTEVTNMTLYFKIGEGNKLKLLWASSVSVGPKYQDAYGYIPSLKTFTGRHSPEVVCPSFMGAVEKTQAKDVRPPLGTACALCTDHQEADAAAYAITYRMLSDYTAKERERLLSKLRDISVPVVVPEKTVNKKTWQDVDLKAKAAAIFSILDTDADGKIAIVELWAGLVDLGYDYDEIREILTEERMPASLKSGDTSESGLESDPMTFQEFLEGLKRAVKVMDNSRLQRFILNVDMFGEYQEMDLLASAGPSSPMAMSFVEGPGSPGFPAQSAQMPTGSVDVEFAREAAKRARMRQLTRRLPKLLANLKNKINHSDLRRIISADSLNDEFGENKIWVCRTCAAKFNERAKEVFDWADDQEESVHQLKVSKKLKTLKDLQQHATPTSISNYPVGEIPALCTPRMYEALRDHTSRVYNIGPQQITNGASKNLVAEYQRKRTKLPEELVAPLFHTSCLLLPRPMIKMMLLRFRKKPKAELPSLRLKELHTPVDPTEPETAELLGRLGLTSRRKTTRNIDFYSSVFKAPGLSKSCNGEGTESGIMNWIQKPAPD